MKDDDKEKLCRRLMGAVFCVFFGNDYPDPNCFDNCVQECLNTEILAVRSLTNWPGWKNVASVFSNCITVGALRKSSGGSSSSSSVYGCPKAARLMPALARFCFVGKLPRDSVVLKQMYELRAIEHARTAVIYDKELTKRQSFLWVKRGSGSAPEEVPEEKDGDEKKDGDEIESSADAYINMADDDSSMADNEDSGAGNGSDTTYSGSRRANDDSSSEENESSS